MVAAASLVVAMPAALGAGWSTWRFGRPGPTGAARHWLPAGLLTVGAAPLAAATPLPVPALLAAGGLAAAAVVDAVEGRVPTPVAHGTAVVGSSAVAAQLLITGQAPAAAGAYLWTAGLLAVFTVAWLSGGIGFGDVRLVPALAPGLTGGVPGALALVYVGLGVLAVLVLVRRRRRWDRPRAPLAPALVAGWFAALGVAGL